MMRFRRKSKFRIEVIIGILLILIFSFEVVGYAYYNRNLNIFGNVSLKKDGIMQISSVSLGDTVNAEEVSSPVYDASNISFDIKYIVSELTNDYYISYDITIDNDSSYDSAFMLSDFTPVISVNDGSSIDYTLDGISLGEIIPKHSSKTFTLTLILDPKSEYTDYDITVDTETEYADENTGYLLVALGDIKTGDLTNSNNIAHFTVDAYNDYDYDKEFSLNINSSAFEFCNASGTPISDPVFTVTSKETETFDFYVKIKGEPSFPNATERLAIMYVEDEAKSLVNYVTLSVTINYFIDNKAPYISNITAVKNNSENSVKVSWDGEDMNTVDHYVVSAYNNSGTLVTTGNTSGSETTLDLLLASAGNYVDGTYYFVVYGIDTASPANSGERHCAGTINSEGYCAKSSNTNLKWYANITYAGSFTNGSPARVLLNTDLSAKITGGSALNYPTLSSIKYANGTTLANNRYSSNRDNSNALNITISGTYVTDDLTITTGSGCLAQGTRILLKGGKEKNIEDVTYYDLVAVWDYTLGKITYMYPVWMEQESSSDYYLKVTFEDGTDLKFISYHSVFNLDLNEYVEVFDPNKLYVGASIAKVKDGKIVPVKVKKIEYVNEDIKYYHVTSPMYYNVIANGFVTTDGETNISNLYGLDSNITWVNRKLEKSYSYNDFKEIVPYYLYYGLRMNEAANLQDKGIDLNAFLYYFTTTQLSEYSILPYPKVGNKHKFIVSTSEGHTKYVLEGEYYTLPGKYEKWENTFDHKVYLSGQKVKINISTYFEKVG